MHFLTILEPTGTICRCQQRCLLLMTTFSSLCLHMVLLLCVAVFTFPLLIRTPVLSDWVYPKTSFKLKYLFKDLISKYSHILRMCLRTSAQEIGEDTVQPLTPHHLPMHSVSKCFHFPLPAQPLPPPFRLPHGSRSLLPHVSASVPAPSPLCAPAGVIFLKREWDLVTAMLRPLQWLTIARTKPKSYHDLQDRALPSTPSDTSLLLFSVPVSLRSHHTRSHLRASVLSLPEMLYPRISA